MRAWFIAGILFLGIGDFVVPEHQTNSPKYQEVTQANTPTIPILPTQPKAEAKYTDSTPKETNLHKWWNWLYLRRVWFWPPTLSNWVLAIVGAIGICVAVRTVKTIQRQAIIMMEQSRILQRQADAMEKQTVSAKTSADSLINSERAWVDGELIKETFPAVRYRLKITNHGKTPARMIGFEIDCGCLSEVGEFSRERLSNRHTGKFHFLLGADKSRMPEEVEPLNMHVIFGGCLGAGAYCVTIRYADVVTEGQNAAVRETSFIYYCQFLLDSLERISEYDKYR